MDENQVITEQDEDGEFVISDDSPPEVLDQIAGIILQDESVASLSDWNESKHPRAKDGEFGSGGGGEGASKPAKYDAGDKKAGPVIDESDPPHIQRFEALYHKELLHDLGQGPALTRKEDNESDTLMQRISKEHGSFADYEKKRRDEGKENPLITKMRQRFLPPEKKAVAAV